MANVKIDWRLAEKMLREFATQEDVANYFGCSVAALKARAQEDLNMEVSEFARKCRSVGISSLRAAAFESAVKDKNPQILKLMLVNYAGLVDKVEQNVNMNVQPVMFVDKLPELEEELPITIEGKAVEDEDGTTSSKT